LTSLLQHPEVSSFTITAIVRDSTKASRLEKLGVKIALGSHSDPALVEPLAHASDIVITAANVDDLEAAQAVLTGLKKRHAETGVAPILIHTVRCAIHILNIIN
jgi:hypothetical protein